MCRVNQHRSLKNVLPTTLRTCCRLWSAKELVSALPQEFLPYNAARMARLRETARSLSLKDLAALAAEGLADPTGANEVRPTLSIHADDLKALNIPSGSKVIVRTEWGEAEFTAQEGKVPLGMAFVPYGPPTCKLMGGDTDGTGMPTSKGWEVEIVRSEEKKQTV